MAIQFQCDCGKPYVVDRSLAGQAVKCKACGAPITIPVVVASRKPKSPPRLPRFSWKLDPKLLLGIVAALVLVSLGLAFVIGLGKLGDRLAGADFLGQFDPFATLDGLLRVVILVGVAVLEFVAPVVLPITLSRFGVLSMSRWLILSLACLFLGFLGSGIYFSAGWIYGFELFHEQQLVGKVVAIPSTLGVLGCLLAAGFYPKGS